MYILSINKSIIVCVPVRNEINLKQKKNSTKVNNFMLLIVVSRFCL